MKAKEETTGWCDKPKENDEERDEALDDVKDEFPDEALNGELNTFNRGKTPYQIALDLMAEEGALALIQMPFFKEANFANFHQELKEQQFILKPMAREVLGQKVPAPAQWGNWALHSIAHNRRSLDAGFIYREWFGLHKGELQSPTIEEYEEMKHAQMFHSPSSRNEYAFAIRLGLDLFIPNAQAQRVEGDDESLTLESLQQANEEAFAAPPQASPTPTLFGTPLAEIDGDNGNGATSSTSLDGVERPAEINEIGRDGLGKSLRFLGIGGGLVGLALGMMFSAKGSMDKMFGNPLTRGLLIQAVAIMALVAQGMARSNLAIVEENKDYVVDILNRFKDQEASQNGIDGVVTQSFTDTVINGFAIPRNARDGEEVTTSIVPCVNGAFEDGTCRSVNLTEDVQNSSTSLGGLGSNAGVRALNSISAGLNDLRNGRVEGALGNFSELENNRGAISAALKRSQDQINDLRKSKGVAPINFEAEAQKVADSINGSIQGAATSRGVSFNPASSAQGASSTNEPATKNETSKSKTVKPKRAKTYKFKPKRSGKNGLLGGLFDEPGVEVNLQSGSNGQKSLSDYDVEYKDVHENNGKHLFMLLHERYVKTAYPRFLEEDISPVRDTSSQKSGGSEFSRQAPEEEAKDGI